MNAAGRPLDATTTADLANLHLQGGVYAGPSKGALSLTGPLVLDGAGDPNSVFIFQTDSTLITGVGSTVTLINGAQECNVFWQVGSSATLGTGSVFVGNILALTSITVTTGVTVHGRALARNGAVTLDNDTFTEPSCATTLPPTTTTTIAGTHRDDDARRWHSGATPTGGGNRDRLPGTEHPAGLRSRHPQRVRSAAHRWRSVAEPRAPRGSARCSVACWRSAPPRHGGRAGATRCRRPSIER